MIGDGGFGPQPPLEVQVSDYDIRIERLTNGYEVTVRDPKIVAANNKPDSKYRNPTREYVFTDVKSVLAFLEKNLDKALPADDFASSFDAAVAELDNEDDDE
jgi:hypothetical protein